MMKKAIAFTVVCLVLAAAGSALSVPYEVDSHTLHLYHFNGDTQDSATANPIHLALDSGATLVDATVPGLGQALYTWEGTAAANKNLPSAMVTPEKAVSNFVGADGAFTFEAMVCSSYGLGAMPNNMQIISGEHDSARGWQFRVESAGNLAFINLTGTIQTILAPLPKDGPHAFVADKWFHVAVAYNGQAGVAGNLKFYWTAMDSGEAQAVELGSFTMNADITPTVAPFFVIGNEGRNGNGRTENWEGWIDEVRISDIAREPAEMVPFVMASKAVRPTPANKATDVPQDVVLGWTPGDSAQTHDVYLGTSAADVDAADRGKPLGALAGQGQDANSFEPAMLALGQVYYWRVDEVEADSTIHKGDVWSFTVEPYSYPIAKVTATASSFNPNMAPENTVNGSGLNADNQHGITSEQMWLSNKAGPQPTWIQFEFDAVYKLDKMWVWNSNQVLEPMIGFGAKDTLIEYSEDGATWTSLGQVVLARAPGAEDYTPETIDLGGVSAKFVKLTISSNWGGVVAQYGLSEVKFFQAPVRARQPMPASEATGVAIDSSLSWRAGREAASHKVYFGTDKQAVTDGTAAVQTVTDNSFDPGALTLGTTYYWKVIEVNEAATPGVWEGDIWSFTTREYLAVDDIETYTDDEGSRIYETWLDGFADKSSGSIIGHMDAPFAERAIVHGGKQSMPFEYNNVDTPFYSEGQREFSPAENWTVSGADALSLWVRGNAAAYVEDAGKVTMTGGGHDIWDNADDFRFAFKTLSGNGSVVVKVESLVNTNVWAKAGVMIRQSLDADSKFVYSVISFSSGASMGWRSLAGGACESATVAGVAAPQWIKLTRTGDVFTAQYSVDGKAWIDVKTATIPSATVAMTGPVYIGLCVTSHNSAAITTAVMSDAAVTGSVSGDWQVATIGDDPQPFNSPTDLYLTVQDSSNKTATVTNASAATSAEWTQWKIPFSSLAGVNLKAVKKLYLGAGSKTNPIKGGWGMFHIDDIGFGHPAQ
jgi:regulation of enolase protein 1 (concanavalin A-like superfamily)